MADHSWLLPLLPLLAVLVCSLWVLRDSQSRQQAHRPVVVMVLGHAIEEPETWTVLCLVLFVIAFPMYLVARRAST